MTELVDALARRPRLRALAAATAAVAAGLFLNAGLRAPSPGDPATGVGAVPVVAAWSARRVPVNLADAVGDLRLPREVDRAFRGSASCFVFEAGGQAVLAHEPGRALIPASTQKVFTAAAAVSVLGADHRFRTEVVGSPPVGGVVERLWIVGGGDPVLATPEFVDVLRADPRTEDHAVTPLAGLADALVEAGVREVPGGLGADASRHSGAPTVPTWKPDYIGRFDITYLSALTVNRGFARFTPVKETAPDPAALAASELARLLRERGVVVGEAVVRGTAPGDASVLARVDAPPVGEVVETLLRESDNLVAELLVREVDVARGGSGTTPGGLREVVRELRRLGVQMDGVSLADGSGLDRGNRATCPALHDTLALRSRPGFDALDDGLAVAGTSGTLTRRMTGPDLVGRLRAKTGSLNDVVGLVGVFERRPPLTFAMIANGAFGSAEGAGIQDDIGEVLAEYPFTFGDPSVLGPPPARPGQAPTELHR